MRYYRATLIVLAWLLCPLLLCQSRLQPLQPLQRLYRQPRP